ncbi:uncharacterized protein MELLADRAFT_108265 [Melampsora larici-populina 98AG31]|uniref:Uncharacterized protein n=1 Tax=Melampsora larici-populina (strain 98AG31 / pathotype 3-4-7) TaxID=747676 RepID=F4RSI4_MELLP|nr:uncharacterized protein MELLADRAFT_108265 [Melampsora larici-populina 98AG31]EGG04688.1 hypothetical protein MELLADRAFT_108265 [Melampsora larici-populina 98AG31]
MSTDKSTRSKKTTAVNSKGQAEGNSQIGNNNLATEESGLIATMLTGNSNNSKDETQQSQNDATTTQTEQSKTVDESNNKSVNDTIQHNDEQQSTKNSTTSNTEMVQDQSSSKRKTPATANTPSSSKGTTKGKRPEGGTNAKFGSDYMSLLASKPTNATNAKLTPSSNKQDELTNDGNEANHNTYDLTTDEPDDLDLNDGKAVWNKALELASIGDIDGASSYFKLHAQLTSKKKSKEEPTPSRESNEKKSNKPVETSSSMTKEDAEIVEEGGLSFIPGAITTHTDIGFTPYFDRNLRELKGPIPLTIFNKQWQELANSYHVEKRVKTDNINKDITTYTGYPYPHEMTQSYAAWNTNYRNFVSVLRDVYKFKTFANWAETHQANVEFYHERDNWMTAFRYDIKIRLNAFAFCVTHNGTNAPPDISQRRENIAAICFAKTRRLNEESFDDNPYAKGGVKYGYDWTTGLPRTSTSNNNNSHQNSHHSFENNNSNSRDNNSSHNNTSNNSNRRPNHRSDHNGIGSRGRGGYNGRNFDPNYAAKKAAAKQNQSGGNV